MFVAANYSLLNSASALGPGTRKRLTYRIGVATSERSDAGSFGDAWIVLHDTDGHKTKRFRLEKGVGRRRKLGAGDTSEFEVETRSLTGVIGEITMGLFERDDRLHVDEVTVEVADEDDEDESSSVFVCGAWVTGARERHFKLTKSSSPSSTAAASRMPSMASLAPVKYEVVVVTADEKGRSNITV